MSSNPNTPSRRVKRTIVRALAILLIGACINACVAWACALWSPDHDNYVIRYERQIIAGVHEYVPPEWWGENDQWGPPPVSGSEGFGVNEFLALGPSEPGHTAYNLDFLVYDDFNLEYRGDLLVVVHTGWPLRVFSSYRPLSTTKPLEDWRGGVVPALKFKTETLSSYIRNVTLRSLTAAPERVRPLPYLPLWRGVVGGTLLYALVVFFFRFVFLLARADRRRRRNLCPACAYPVGVSPNCTECGHTLRPAPLAPAP